MLHTDALLHPLMHHPGITMKKKTMTAALDMAEHVIEHEELCSTIPEETLAVWTAQIEDWERDATKPNPFSEVFEGTCINVTANVSCSSLTVLRPVSSCCMTTASRG